MVKNKFIMNESNDCLCLFFDFISVYIWLANWIRVDDDYRLWFVFYCCVRKRNDIGESIGLKMTKRVCLSKKTGLCIWEFPKRTTLCNRLISDYFNGAKMVEVFSDLMIMLLMRTLSNVTSAAPFISFILYFTLRKSQFFRLILYTLFVFSNPSILTP